MTRRRRINIDDILSPLGWPRRRVFLAPTTVYGEDDDGDAIIGTVGSDIFGRPCLSACVQLSANAVAALMLEFEDRRR